PVGIGHLERADESCLNRGGDRFLLFVRAALEQIHLYERHVRLLSCVVVRDSSPVVYIPIGILTALSSRVDDTIERERPLLREAQRAWARESLGASWQSR